LAHGSDTGRLAVDRAAAISVAAPHPYRPRIAELDGLRGLACLGVLLAHFPTGDKWPVYAFVMEYFAVGNLSMIVFYSLSAFLLTYLAVLEAEQWGSFDVKRFYIRRMLRIWPLYFVVLVCGLVAVAPWGPMPGGYGVDRSRWSWLVEHLWLFLTFTGNWSLALNHLGSYVDRSTPNQAILWSIGVEEQFYVVFPILLGVCLRHPGARHYVIAATVIVAVCFRGGFPLIPTDGQPIGTSGGMYYATLTYADVLLFGAIAGWGAAHTHRRLELLPRLFRAYGAPKNTARRACAGRPDVARSTLVPIRLVQRPHLRVNGSLCLTAVTAAHG
jgi:peptidoglycan/LPS O-acetylase OafA/YrhL